MFTKLLRNLTFAAVSLAVVTSLHSKVSGQDDSDSDRQQRRVIVIEQDEDEPDANTDRRIVIRRSEIPKFWIGVACSIADDGVSIAEVLKDSPAEKADLQVDDRIVSVGDRKIGNLSDLVDSVQNSEGKEIKIEIRRGDETHSVAVTPEQRPRHLDADLDDLNLGEDWQNVMPRLRGLIDGELEDFDISMIHPGIVIGGEAFPAGVSISIRRENDEPAKLTIKRDGETWEVTEDSIDQLPQELRGPARKMLAAAGGRSILRRPDVKRFENIFPGSRRVERSRQDKDSNAELREELEQMRKEIRELHELLKELKNDK
jgi:membrane-associated protease RseP (regulator of RpoE activity)